VGQLTPIFNEGGIMKNLIVGLIATCLLITNVSFGSISTNEKFLLNKHMGPVAAKVQLGTKMQQVDVLDGSSTVTNASQGVDNHLAKRVVRVTYDFAADGGAISAINLGQGLPEKAIIQRSWFEVITQLTSGGASTMAIHCESANNIFSAADITGSAAGTITEGVSTGTAATMQKITNDCNITATIAVATVTAGKLVIYVEYVVSE